MTKANTIASVLEAGGVESSLAARMAVYGEMVLAANATMNLTAAREPEAFAEQILDALTLRADVNGALIDLGSGAGLPGIPLAIATGNPVVLVDSVGKKAQFLARALQELDLVGEAIAQRAESLARVSAYREAFRFATARAVASAPAVAELAVPFLAIGGKALLQRGILPERERQAVNDAALMLGAQVVEERLVSGDRRILVLMKVSATQQRFPRRDGVPQKRPLCLA